MGLILECQHFRWSQLCFACVKTLRMILFSVFPCRVVCDISRWHPSRFAQHHETEVCFDEHHWTWLWSVGWTSQPWGVDSPGAGWRSQWKNGLQKKCRHVGSAGVRRPVWQVCGSITADQSATCREFYHAKWRSVTIMLVDFPSMVWYYWIVWLRNVLVSPNKVTLRGARLMLRGVTICSFTCNHTSIPRGQLRHTVWDGKKRANTLLELLGFVDLPFGGFADSVSHLWGSIPPKPPTLGWFWGNLGGNCWKILVIKKYLFGCDLFVHATRWQTRPYCFNHK